AERGGGAGGHVLQAQCHLAVITIERPDVDVVGGIVAGTNGGGDRFDLEREPRRTGLGAGRPRAAGDAVGVERIPDAAAVGRAVGEIAVVVVNGQVDRVPVVAATAIDIGGWIALAAAGDPVGALGWHQAA